MTRCFSTHGSWNWFHISIWRNLFNDLYLHIIFHSHDIQTFIWYKLGLSWARLDNVLAVSPGFTGSVGGLCSGICVWRRRLERLREEGRAGWVRGEKNTGLGKRKGLIFFLIYILCNSLYQSVNDWWRRGVLISFFCKQFKQALLRS